MKKIFNLFLLTAIIALNSCSIEKRIYQPGYFISGKSSSPKEAKIQKQLQPTRFSESATTIAKEESSKVIEHEDTARIKLNESYPIIEASNETKILPHEIPVTAALASDSIPDETKLLFEKYKKNRSLKMTLRKIAMFPLALFAVGAFGAILFFLPWVYGATEDKVIIAFLRICAVAAIILLPLAILFLITSIVTKKQRRKLRAMGLIK